MLWALFAKHGNRPANQRDLTHGPGLRQNETAGDATLFIERRRKVSKAKRERGKEEGSEPRVYRRHPIGLKQQAVERMNLGENVSALARELGVDRINLYRWRAELRKGPWGAKRWNWIFSPVPCAGSRGHASREASLARQHLLGNPPRGASARRNKHRADVRTGGGEPGRFLSAMGTARAV